MERRHFQGTPLPVPLPACAGRGDSIRHLFANTLPKTDLRSSFRPVSSGFDLFRPKKRIFRTLNCWLFSDRF
jgi:hypothetical protein